MTPEQSRLLDLLLARAFRRRAENHLELALAVEEFESDGRSRAFEVWFDRALQGERFAYLIEIGRLQLDADALDLP